MTAYRNVGRLNSPNTNNNNNNTTTRHHLSATLERDTDDYSSTKYNQQQQNYKSSTMPKSHYQNITTTKDFLPTDNGTNYVTASSSFETESNSSTNEASKRINSTNGKFSLQKMIRHGFSSWRTRKKPPSMSTPPPIASIYTNSPTPPPVSQPPLSAGRYMTNNDDLPQNPPPTAIRSISVDSTSPQRIIVTEPVTLSSARANSVDNVTADFDRPPTNPRGYNQSPWSSSSTTTTSNTIESISRPTPVPINRTLPVQFTDNTRTPAPRSPLPPSSFVSPPFPPASAPSTTKSIETNNSTSTASNPPRIPPPGIIFLFLKSVYRLLNFFSFSCS
jgi:hypothetical protein